MIKPNLIFSHDWHVQPNCQRSLRALRLSGTLGIEAQPFGQLVLELVALANYAFDCVFWRFCANLSNISKISPPVKPGQDDSRSKAAHSAKYQTATGANRA
jgi:hypothetical protein